LAEVHAAEPAHGHDQAKVTKGACFVEKVNTRTIIQEGLISFVRSLRTCSGVQPGHLVDDGAVGDASEGTLGNIGQGGAEPVGHSAVHARSSFAVKEQAVISNTVSELTVKTSKFGAEGLTMWFKRETYLGMKDWLAIITNIMAKKRRDSRDWMAPGDKFV